MNDYYRLSLTSLMYGNIHISLVKLFTDYGGRVYVI